MGYLPYYRKYTQNDNALNLGTCVDTKNPCIFRFSLIFLLLLGRSQEDSLTPHHQHCSEKASCPSQAPAEWIGYHL